MRFWILLAGAAFFRAALLLWGAFQDAHSAVPYTDVDYFVFSDAAACIAKSTGPNCTPAQGWLGVTRLGDPYSRATYRYTPLLAVLLAPNALHPFFGKVIFAGCDLLVGALLYLLMVLRGSSHNRAWKTTAAVWLFNPIVANISTRGSSESMVGALVLATLALSERQSWDVAAMAYGAAVHVKIFPVMYASSLLPALLKPGEWRRTIGRTVRFVILSLTSFIVLGSASYLLWGEPFIQETYLYHLRRLDHRHNFAAYFYLYYLEAAQPDEARLGFLQALARHPLAAFLPQLSLSLGLGLAFGSSDLCLAWFLQTFAFVTFNKVCTSQYFLWFLWLVPPVTSRLAWTWKVGSCVGAIWVGGQALWLSQAYELEFAGSTRYQQVWLASVAFLVTQTWVLGQLLKSLDPTRVPRSV
ncbi:hypothetical protein JCM11641_001265 [Rhodosporidiobolus odoratus]